MKAAMIGSGNMGTALAGLLAENGWKVTCWDHVPEVVEDIHKNHRNERYLPGVELHPSIQGELILERVVKEASMVVVAVPSPYFRHVMAESLPFLKTEAVVLNVAKGLEPSTSKRLSEVFAETARHSSERFVTLAGPAVAMDFSRKKPTCVLAASESESCRTKVAAALTHSHFRVDTISDVAGAEWGGVLKNVYAIGLGLLDGLDSGGSNLRAAFAVASMNEMRRLGTALGAQAETLNGLAGLGDLVATGFSTESHNRRLGEYLGRGKNFEDALDAMGGGVPEGVRSATLAVELAAKQKVEVPIAAAVEACLKTPVVARPRFLAQVLKAC